jgi:hypothetical protein
MSQYLKEPYGAGMMEPNILDVGKGNATLHEIGSGSIHRSVMDLSTAAIVLFSSAQLCVANASTKRNANNDYET